METSNATQVKDLNGLKVGDKLVWSPSNNSDSLYWATISKITSKGVTLEVPDASYHDRVVNFRMKEYYRGGDVLQAYGEKHWGSLWRADDATVQACYDARAAYAAQENAKRDAEEQKRLEYCAKERVEALAANGGVKFNPIGMMGKVSYYAANMVDHNEKPCFAVLAVRYMVDEYNWDNPGKMVWVGALNYAEAYDDKPHTMASCSPSDNGDTLEELFQNVIVRVW